MILFDIEITENSQKLINTYIEELLKWNRAVNLIGRSTEKNIWETHIKDSLELFPYLESNECPDIIDIGSGGGIPAIPLSILLPKKKFYLTETDSKKLAFLEYTTNKLRINTLVIDINRGFIFEGMSLIISRAYSSIANIIKWGDKHAPGCLSYYLLKGRENVLKEELVQSGIKNYKIMPLEKGTLLIIENS